MNAIETRALTKYYGKARGVLDLNLTVGEGEFFGFIGPNGAGKSTTIRCLLGLICPTSGGSGVLGMDCAGDRRKLLAQVGYLPSEVMFYPGMRVRDVIRYSARLRGQDCEREARALCERLQVQTDRRVEELSLGNRKKVAIVCAMQHRPRLYVMDEPTSGLDPLMQREFFALLGERHAQGATVFLSSHVLSEIQRHCTRAAIIREGRIIACDHVEALARAGARRVTLHGTARAPEIPGVRDEQRGAQGVSFLYNGEMNALIRALSRMDVRDMTVAEPDLEEVFLHYYEEGGERHDDL